LLIISYRDKVKLKIASDIIQLFLIETFPSQLLRTVMKLVTKIEDIFYLKGKPLSLTEIAQCADCKVDEVQEAINVRLCVPRQRLRSTRNVPGL
jgi:hypothetical protein